MLSKEAGDAVDIGTGRALNNAEAESFISQYNAKKAKAQKKQVLSTHLKEHIKVLLS